jgi:EAL domain-containing protein (putative c-di-GMP-specific phosphodiesterase class I)
LKQLGCDIVQGFYVSTPVPPAAFAQLLATFDGSKVGAPRA